MCQPSLDISGHSLLSFYFRVVQLLFPALTSRTAFQDRVASVLGPCFRPGVWFHLVLALVNLNFQVQKSQTGVCQFRV